MKATTNTTTITAWFSGSPTPNIGILCDRAVHATSRDPSWYKRPRVSGSARLNLGDGYAVVHLVDDEQMSTARSAAHTALLSRALQYVEDGVSVFPISPGRKVPVPGGHGFKDASDDPAQIESWWLQWPAANIGGPTGQSFVILDIDPRNGGNLDVLEANFNFEPPALRQRTAHGGWHFFFTGEELPTVTDLLPGVDVKAIGGYILLEPSRISGRCDKCVPPHAYGTKEHPGTYELSGPLELMKLEPVPEWLRELVKANRGSNHPAAASVEGKIAAGARNKTLASIAGTMRRRGISEASILAALREENQLRCDPPLENREVEQIARSVARYEPASNISDGRSASSSELKLRLDAGEPDLSKATRAIFGALATTDDPPSLFRFAGNPARLERDDDGDLVVVPLGTRAFRYELAERFEWFRTKITKDGAKELVASPPMSHVENTLAADRQPFPVLRRLVRSPIVSSEGTISTKRGYDHRTKTYLELDPKLRLRDIPSRPSHDEIRGAVTLITKDLFGDFPFTSDSELAHAAGLFLLPFARELIDGPTPNHLVEKPAPGTGASLLAKLCMTAFEGRAVSMLSLSSDEAETRKLITSVLGTAPTYACFDNVTCEVRSGVLSKALTDSVWEDRVLGVSQQVRFPVRVVWVMTANNPAFSNEIARRTVRIRLDSKADKPWERKDFRHPNIEKWALEHRCDLICAALVLIRTWLEAGRPGGDQSIGTYEAWSSVIGGILCLAGIKGFLENRAAFYEASDAEQEGLRSFVEAWFDTFGSAPMKVKELCSFVQAQDIELPLGRDDATERALQIRLGRLLGRHRDWQFGDLRLVRGAKSKGSCQWRIER